MIKQELLNEKTVMKILCWIIVIEIFMIITLLGM